MHVIAFEIFANIRGYRDNLLRRSLLTDPNPRYFQAGADVNEDAASDVAPGGVWRH